MTGAVEALIDEPVAVPSTDELCNFYRDDTVGAAGRRQALAAYLTSQWDAPLFVVGEAPGYKGARQSGVPFTALRHLHGTGPSESTATVMRRELSKHGLLERSLLWNVLPFHPHKPREPRSNRPPKPAERIAHVTFALRLAEGRRIVTVGEVARAHFPRAFHHLRHPSNDIERVFPAQVAELAAKLAHEAGPMPSR